MNFVITSKMVFVVLLLIAMVLYFVALGYRVKLRGRYKELTQKIREIEQLNAKLHDQIARYDAEIVSSTTAIAEKEKAMPYHGGGNEIASLMTYCDRMRLAKERSEQMYASNLEERKQLRKIRADFSDKHPDVVAHIRAKAKLEEEH